MFDRRNNLIKQANWYNPYACICENYDKECELNNIFIYNENGILIETRHGWFNESNNYTGDCYIENGIFKITDRQKEKYLKDCKNFILYVESGYDKTKKYNLYIYYKNVNYQFLGFYKDSLFVELQYTLFDNKKYEINVGDSRKYSQEVRYELLNLARDFESKIFSLNAKGILVKTKKINKYAKLYDKLLEEEKTYPIEKLFYSEETNNKEFVDMCMQMIENNKKLNEEKEN